MSDMQMLIAILAIVYGACAIIISSAKQNAPESNW